MSAPPQDESDAPPVTNWVAGLPDVVIPLTQPLFPPEIASSFFISPVPRRSYSDVTRAAEETISLMRGLEMTAVSESGFNRTVYDEKSGQERIENVVDDDESGDEGEGEREGEGDNLGNKAVKRPRLVWTPRLHTRFMEVVEHLGIKNAVPKTIMQLMNVEGLTRENVASHMQKYRLYLKRMNGGLGEASGSQELCSESNASGNVGNEGTGRNPMVNYGVVPGHGMVPVPLPGYGVPDCLMGGNSSGLGGCGGFDYGMVTGREWNGDINGPV